MNTDKLLTATSDNDEQNNNRKSLILESGQKETYMSEPVLTAVNRIAENEREVTKTELKKLIPSSNQRKHNWYKVKRWLRWVN